MTQQFLIHNRKNNSYESFAEKENFIVEESEYNQEGNYSDYYYQESDPNEINTNKESEYNFEGESENASIDVNTHIVNSPYTYRENMILKLIDSLKKKWKYYTSPDPEMGIGISELKYKEVRIDYSEVAFPTTVSDTTTLNNHLKEKAEIKIKNQQELEKIARKPRFRIIIEKIWMRNKPILKLFIVTFSLFLLFLYYINIIGIIQSFIPEEKFVDSKNRSIVSPLFYHEREIVFYDDIYDYYYIEWMKSNKKAHSTIAEEDYNNGYFTTLVYSENAIKNVSIEKLEEVMLMKCTGKCTCISAYHFGIPKNIIMIMTNERNGKKMDRISHPLNSNKTRPYMLLFDAYIDYHSSEKRNATIKTYNPQGNNQISQKVTIPVSLITQSKNVEGYIERHILEKYSAVCAYQFLDAKNHYLDK